MYLIDHDGSSSKCQKEDLKSDPQISRLVTLFDYPDRAFNFAKIPSQEIGEDPNVKCTDSIQVVKF